MSLTTGCVVTALVESTVWEHHVCLADTVSLGHGEVGSPDLNRSDTFFEQFGSRATYLKSIKLIKQMSERTFFLNNGYHLHLQLLYIIISRGITFFAISLIVQFHRFIRTV